MYFGLQKPDPNFQKEENVSVDVAWPEAGKSGFALCTVTVKLGDQTVSKSKLQVIVDEP
jgi:orotate phosphoribosyltransferase-like protein